MSIYDSRQILLRAILNPYYSRSFQQRQILNAIFIDNEIVDEKRCSREKGVVFKINFEKVYDHVD